MRKKKNQTEATAQVDFYTEALKAFDAPLPPSEEELLAQELATAKKLRRRRRLWVSLTASVLVCTVALLLWHPWKPEITPLPGVTIGPNWQIGVPRVDSISFYLEKSPGNPAVSYAPSTGAIVLSEDEGAALYGQLSEQEWTSMLILSTIQISVGSFELSVDGQIQHFEFDADGTLFRDGYMVKADSALWSQLMTLLQRASQELTPGGFIGALADGSTALLQIQEDGSFHLQTGGGVDVEGAWTRVNEFLILSATVDKRYGIIVFEIGADGSLYYSPSHSCRNLAGLGNDAVFDPMTTTENAVAIVDVYLSMSDTDNGGYGQSGVLGQRRLNTLVDLLSHVDWMDASLTNYRPNYVGYVSVQVDTLGTILFSQDGYLLMNDRLGKLSPVDWYAFVELLAAVGSEMTGVYHINMGSGNIIVLDFYGHSFMRFVSLDDGSGTETGSCMRIGDLLLLAGENGYSQVLVYDDTTDVLTDPEGNEYKSVEFVYG